MPVRASFVRTLAALLSCFLVAAISFAQKEKREPLTEAQQDQIAEAGIDPPGRVTLYVKFLDEHAWRIRALIKRAKSTARSRRLDGELQDFAALMDELGDNLDVFAERKADLRKSFKVLNAGVENWQGVLHDLPSEPGFELSLKEAADSGNDLAKLVQQITVDQEAYFTAHPEEKGQQRWEPK